jgi:hypothetical protein
MRRKPMLAPRSKGWFNAAEISSKLTAFRKPRSPPVDRSPSWDGAVIAYNPEDDYIYLPDDKESPLTPASAPWVKDVNFEQSYQDDVLQCRAPRSPESLASCQTTIKEMSPHEPLLSPRSMDSPVMRVQTAMGFWFKHLLQIPRLPDALRGYMEILGPMYLKASASSILHQATHALALAALSNGQRSPLIRTEARKMYANALKETGDAIRDPKQARSNELLMAILLFSLYETITSTDNSRQLWTRHINGAVTLTKLRGEKMTSDPVSLHLFRAVRTHMVALPPL